MAITGVHMLFHSPEAQSLRATLRNAFGWSGLDIGDGWLIFATPPGELGVHPSDQPGHEISLMCDDLNETIAGLEGSGVTVRGEPEERRFGRAVTAVLPGGVEVLIYQPSHPTAIGIA